MTVRNAAKWGNTIEQYNVCSFSTLIIEERSKLFNATQIIDQICETMENLDKLFKIGWDKELVGILGTEDSEN